jgi:hypothetical protein
MRKMLLVACRLEIRKRGLLNKADCRASDPYPTPVPQEPNQEYRKDLRVNDLVFLNTTKV